MPVLWRVFAANAAVLAVATLLLAVSPATVSFPVTVAEAVVLAGGLAVTLALNLGLLPWVFGSARGITSSRAVPPRAGVGSKHPQPAGEPTGGVSVRECPAHAASRPASPDAGMERLLVCWRRPQHLSDGEAEAWASTELVRLLAAERIAAARLSRLHGASVRYDKPCDWLLELDATPGRDAQSCVESPVWSAWLSDLQLLKLQPGVMVAEPGRVLTVGED
jgi:hypothetical protein